MKKRKAKKPADIMRGRSLAGAEYGATEKEQTEAIERASHPKIDEVDGWVTDAELEARVRSAKRRGR